MEQRRGSLRRLKTRDARCITAQNTEVFLLCARLRPECGGWAQTAGKKMLYSRSRCRGEDETEGLLCSFLHGPSRWQTDALLRCLRPPPKIQNINSLTSRDIFTQGAWSGDAKTRTVYADIIVAQTFPQQGLSQQRDSKPLASYLIKNKHPGTCTPISDFPADQLWRRLHLKTFPFVPSVIANTGTYLHICKPSRAYAPSICMCECDEFEWPCDPRSLLHLTA